MNYSISDLMNGARTMATNFFGNKEVYQLQFDHEDDGCWYIHYPEWPFNHHNLMMVEGADDMCEALSDDGKVTHVEVIPSDKRRDMKGYIELEQKDHSLTGGSTYEVHNLPGFTHTVWICPVTLFVLGKYPKFIYLKKNTGTAN